MIRLLRPPAAGKRVLIYCPSLRVENGACNAIGGLAPFGSTYGGMVHLYCREDVMTALQVRNISLLFTPLHPAEAWSDHQTLLHLHLQLHPPHLHPHGSIDWCF